jgi:hypothetical protein
MIDPTNPEDVESIESLILDLSTLRAATNNFDESNKLGEGGFGIVYKVLIISFLHRAFILYFNILLVNKYTHLYRESFLAMKK